MLRKDYKNAFYNCFALDLFYKWLFFYICSNIEQGSLILYYVNFDITKM